VDSLGFISISVVRLTCAGDGCVALTLKLCKCIVRMVSVAPVSSPHSVVCVRHSAVLALSLSHQLLSVLSLSAHVSWRRPKQEVLINVAGHQPLEVNVSGVSTVKLARPWPAAGVHCTCTHCFVWHCPCIQYLA
jgi:hypothetical protein